MYRRLALYMSVLLVFAVQVEAQNDPNLVGYWDFDDGTVTDLSGNGNNGTLMGQATVTDFADMVFGGLGYSLDINFQNSNSDWVQIPHSDSLNITNELSILLWIRPDEIENWDGMVCKGSTKSPWACGFPSTSGTSWTTRRTRTMLLVQLGRETSRVCSM